MESYTTCTLKGDKCSASDGIPPLCVDQFICLIPVVSAHNRGSFGHSHLSRQDSSSLWKPINLVRVAMIFK